MHHSALIGSVPEPRKSGDMSENNLSIGHPGEVQFKFH